MKIKTALILLVIIASRLSTTAQTNFNYGGGYFGETITYPGIIVELEREKFHADYFSTPVKLNIGFYNHPRSHNALFLDIHEGFRRYSKTKKWYFEQSVGFGIMLSFYNEDVWHVDDQGNVTTVSKFANLDYMPSITFGVGYNLTPNKNSSNFLWLRPKVFWQIPFNSLALPHLAIQLGYTRTFKSKNNE